LFGPQHQLQHPPERRQGPAGSCNSTCQFALCGYRLGPQASSRQAAGGWGLGLQGVTHLIVLTPWGNHPERTGIQSAHDRAVRVQANILSLLAQPVSCSSCSDSPFAFHPHTRNFLENSSDKQGEAMSGWREEYLAGIWEAEQRNPVNHELVTACLLHTLHPI